MISKKGALIMSFIPKPHEIYKHFKGNLYQIVAIAQHTETEETLVVYQAMYGDFKIYARPLEMFIGLVDKNKYPDATQEFRFELQGADEARMQERRVAQTAVNDAMDGQEQMKTSSEAMKVQKQADMMVDADNAVTQDDMPEGELNLDPMVLEFLDADSYEEKLNILAGLHHRITDEMLTTMAIASDIELNDGSTEERFEALKKCLLTLEKYECHRLH